MAITKDNVPNVFSSRTDDLLLKIAQLLEANGGGGGGAGLPDGGVDGSIITYDLFSGQWVVNPSFAINNYSMAVIPGAGEPLLFFIAATDGNGKPTGIIDLQNIHLLNGHNLDGVGLAFGPEGGLVFKNTASGEMLVIEQTEAGGPMIRVRQPLILDTEESGIFTGINIKAADAIMPLLSVMDGGGTDVEASFLNLTSIIFKGSGDLNTQGIFLKTDPTGALNFLNNQGDEMPIMRVDKDSASVIIFGDTTLKAVNYSNPDDLPIPAPGSMYIARRQDNDVNNNRVTVAAELVYNDPDLGLMSVAFQSLVNK